MKKLILAAALCVAVFIAGCATIQSTLKSALANSPKLVVTSKEYKESIVPLIEVLKLIYADKLSAQQKQYFKTFLDELDRQAQVQEEVNVLPAVVAVAVPVVLNKTGGKVKITKLREAEAEIGLSIVERKFGDDPVMKSILPAVKQAWKEKVQVE